MKRYLLFTLIFSNLSFSQDLTLEGLRDMWEEVLKLEDNLKTLVCSGTKTIIIRIDNEVIPDDDNKESFTEYIYLGSDNVFLRQNGELHLLGTSMSGEWKSILNTETFNMNDASINYSMTKDRNYYKENPEAAKLDDDLTRTQWKETLSIDRYTGKFTHTYQQDFRYQGETTISERTDRLEGMCKLAGKKQF